MDLLIYAKDKGFDAAYYDGSMNDLREKLRERRPLILFLNMGFESYPIGHYIVVVGYNDRMEAVIAHSGLNREEVWRYPDLLRRWEKTGYGTLLITPRQRP
ncbi:MAG: hypothetical protein HZB83_02270 [Deltaproteobacteria bacterium]|nr:hypothetical protein [Deltaproteobacteria bacterium]